MDFEFTDEQQALRDALRRWVDKGFAFERRHALAKAGGATREVWRELAALGLTGLTVAPEHGGMGLGAVEAMVVGEELGRGLVNAPWAQAALLAPALLAAAPPPLRAAWLPKIADGSALVIPALQERSARYRVCHVQTRAAHSEAGGWRISGAKGVVPAGDEADAFVLAARTAGDDDAAPGIGLFLVERGAEGLGLRGYPTQDGARAAELTLAATPARMIDADAAQSLSLASDLGIAASAAEGVGLMERLLEITLEYMRTRHQFGVPIASFQALRHRVAELKMALELGRSMSYYATLSLGAPEPQRRRALSQAKLQLGQSMRLVGQQCIQLHGGIGVTDEYVASHFFKRLTMLELAFGDSLHHLGEVSARMQDKAGVFA